MNSAGEAVTAGSERCKHVIGWYFRQLLNLVKRRGRLEFSQLTNLGPIEVMTIRGMIRHGLCFSLLLAPQNAVYLTLNNSTLCLSHQRFFDGVF
ncbi:hypothetical protein LWI28_021382 [Acer negundo]|uniref:Uncharacterized protein n=1 Tax=Acer negundo TaxID=4023 RepID=A0AAD5JAE0_ACENE|nr:hypothetical protein LWI28_021382 [Acer negundo]